MLIEKVITQEKKREKKNSERNNKYASVNLVVQINKLNCMIINSLQHSQV